MGTVYDQSIASFDDSFQPTGVEWDGIVPHMKMKKLHHDLHLVIDGPDGADIKKCLVGAAEAGMVAVVSAYITGGTAIVAAEGIFLGVLGGCLGADFSARLDDRSHWVNWVT